MCEAERIELGEWSSLRGVITGLSRSKEGICWTTAAVPHWTAVKMVAVWFKHLRGLTLNFIYSGLKGLVLRSLPIQVKLLLICMKQRATEDVSHCEFSGSPSTRKST
jgi:hypothetical protein